MNVAAAISFWSILWVGLVRPVIAVALLLAFVAFSVLLFIWLERKVSARIQDRLGPCRVGGKFGWLQTVADGIKLLLKEDLIPALADKQLFRLAPYISFVSTFCVFLVLPFSNGWAAQNLNVAVFMFLALASVEVFGVILAGYSSSSKWALFGGIREAVQMVSYEVPLGLCLLLPIMAAGTMNLNEIGRMQEDGIWSWLCFNDPFTFFAAITYFVCATAAVKRAPFDLAEAESELVAGFHTEYSGIRWAFFFMAEYAGMFAVSALAATVFWGAWSGPLPITKWLGLWHVNEHGLLVPGVIAKLLGLVNFILKGYFGVFVMMWMRWTLPRVRIDQVMKTCLRYLLPISCFLLLGGGLWQAFVPDRALGRLVGGSIAVAIALIVLAIAIGTAPKSAAYGLREEVY